MQHNPATVLPLEKGKRLLSLDIFRGITMAAMILVNDPGIESRIYGPLKHAEWNGITPTDYIFPSFIFIVGVSIVLSCSKQLENGIAKKFILRKILRRVVILFLLGVLLSILQTFDFSKVRITGVLQRISIVFFCCSLLYLNTTKKFQIRLGISILLAYFLLMTVVPVPGYGYAILEPGKNLAAWIDQLVIPGKLFNGTWDPEGVLSTFPAIVTGIAGMLAGHLLLSKNTAERKIIWLFFAGFISFAIANAWNWFFPINKNLWTSSFVLYTAGLDSMMLAFLYFLVDVLGIKKWSKFAVVFGSNAIAAYLASEIFYDVIYYRFGGKQGTSLNETIINAVLPSGLSPEFISLLWALLYCLFCYIPVYLMYRKKIFLKI
ncbi:acyltransferase family protein [Flavihumibacter profundi]|jgi:predicted acyltransferase|uniref:acyltransferase family protein n=1 Tax=Flavihumibacter profundi TaxID=2716883 RepID=UPI001CC6E797|nr:heparan-alpha-glucosaminide N-acetyltransferase domain-containing protein [Flavihumibacter profundi]MBZ5856006.1 heparan-alpha-glucosaminide N-acetyltransferase domain-containing protein [Flavihumibacter profundi]